MTAIATLGFTFSIANVVLLGFGATTTPETWTENNPVTGSWSGISAESGTWIPVSPETGTWSNI